MVFVVSQNESIFVAAAMAVEKTEIFDLTSDR